MRFYNSEDEENDSELTTSAPTDSPSNVDFTDRVNKRRALQDDYLNNHKRQQLQKKVSVDSQLLFLAKKELDLKKEMLKQEREINDEYKKV